MENSPTWDTNRNSASKETTHILWNPKLHDTHHLFPVLRHMNAVYTFMSALLDPKVPCSNLSDIQYMYHCNRDVCVQCSLILCQDTLLPTQLASSCHWNLLHPDIHLNGKSHFDQMSLCYVQAVRSTFHISSTSSQNKNLPIFIP